MSRARQEVADFWDEVVSDFFAGREPTADKLPALRSWRGAYDGQGRGLVTEQAFPEPYMGRLAPRHGLPRLLALGLNPGEADLAFQGRQGVFRKEIERAGGFSAWAATAPYLREPWRSAHRRNVYHERLLTFARRWNGDSSVQSDQVLVMELFPWHSTAVTGDMRTDPRLVDDFVWAPLAEIDSPVVFAFGAPWGRVAEALGLREEPLNVDFSTAARRARLFRLTSGQRLVVCWQAGYAGPPGTADLGRLRQALAGSTGETEAASAPLVRNRPRKHRTRSSAPAAAGDVRARYVTGLMAHANPALRRLGLGPIRPAKVFLPVRWPLDLWYGAWTQNGDLHLAITQDALQVRIHIDRFHGDRARNEEAFDKLRAAAEEDLLRGLPEDTDLDWRAARGGNNQVCALTRPGGLGVDAPESDADWVVTVVRAWLDALRAHPLEDT